MERAQHRDIKRRQKAVLKSLGSDVLILATDVGASGGFGHGGDGNFFYLTGFPESRAVVVLDPTQDREPVALFVKAKIRHEEVWEGFAIGVQAAGETFPVDRAHDIRRLEATLKDRLQGRTVYFKSASGMPVCRTLDGILEDAGCTVRETGAPFDRIADLRIVKSAWELKQIREAVRITGEAHHACMRMGGTHRFEYQFETEFEHTCKMQGVRRFGFHPIVAAGAHAPCQHYMENDGPVGPDELVLIDAGAAWNRYTADLTRTFPASGTFSPVQRDLYAVVLASQKAGVAAVRPGVRIHDLHVTAARVLIDGLKDLGILHGATDEIIEKKAYQDFWPGGLAHSLGLNVHDVTPAAYRGPEATKTLAPGMVITIEPGFYGQDFNHQLPERFKHIGIRIEDDVLVTKSGHENLSVDTVKEIEAVEAMVQAGPR